MARVVSKRAARTSLARRVRERVEVLTTGGLGCSLLVLRALASGAPSEAEAAQLAALPALVRGAVRRTDDVLTDGTTAVALVLAGTSAEGARAVTERLRETLEQPPSPLDPDARVMPIHLGIGTATLDAAPTRNPLDLLESMESAWRPHTLLTAQVPVRTLDQTAALAPTGGRTRTSGVMRRRASDLAAAGGSTPSSRPSRRGSKARLRLLEPSVHAASPALRLRAEALGVPFLHLPTRLPAGCRAALDVELARCLRAVVIGATRDALTVAMHDPSDTAAVLRLRAATGKVIFPVLAAPEELDRALLRLAR